MEARIPELERLLCRNPWLDAALRALDGAGPPDAWIAAGCVAQTVWNLRLGRAPEAGIRDLDLIWHDPSDLSAEAEAAEQARLGALLGALPRGLPGGLPVRLDARNQARVHLWYEARFGRAIAPYPSAAAAVATFPATATAVAVRRRFGRFEALAPFGLDDLLGLVVRPNTRLVTREVYEAKAARWHRVWPALTILPWPEAPCAA